MTDLAGRMFMIPSFVVECGRCEERESLDGCQRSADAPQHARDIGWKLTKADGWVCPQCLTQKSP